MTTTPAILAQVGSITLRPMRDDLDDYARMAHWMTDERVLAFYGGRDRPRPLEVVMTKYRPRICGESPVVACFILCDGEPIGYVQYYRLCDQLNDVARETYGAWVTETSYGFDIFIGEPAVWGQGLGTLAVAALVDYLFHTRGATCVTVDPRVDNPRAVRCYEKAGLRKVKLLPNHEHHEGADHDGWLMVVERPIL
jgi:aminoglycoside 6'-N-acetyltransferase